MPSQEYGTHYSFKQTGNILCIKENEWTRVAAGVTVTFGTFTSCIGVLAAHGNELTAVHIVQSLGGESVVGPDGSVIQRVPDISFGYGAALSVLNILPKVIDSARICGFVDLWEDMAPFIPGYPYLYGEIERRMVNNGRIGKRYAWPRNANNIRFSASLDGAINIQQL